MDPRHHPPDSPEPRWYGGERRYADQEWDVSGGASRYPDDPYRAPGQRGAAVEEPVSYGGREPQYAPSDPLGVGYPDGERYTDPARRPEPDPRRGPEQRLTDSTGSIPAVPPAPPGPPPGSVPPGTMPPGTMPPGSMPPGAMQPGHHPTETIDRSALRRPGPAPAPPNDGLYRTRRTGLAVLFIAVAAVAELPALRLLATAATADRVVAGEIVASVFLALALPITAFGLYAMATGAGRSGDPRAPGWLRPPTGYLTIGLALCLAAAIAAN